MSVKRMMGCAAWAAAGLVAVAEEVPWVYRIEDHPPVVTHSASATLLSPWAAGGLSARVRSSLRGNGYNVVTTPNGMFIVIH